MARNRRKEFQNIEVIDIADKGYAVGRAEDGQIVMVENAVPGDLLNMQGFKKKKSMWWGRPTEILRASDYRQEPFCPHFQHCGGCQWQHMAYAQQALFKEKKVKDSIMRLAKINDCEFLTIIPAEQNVYYRNKMEFSFSDQRWLTEDEISSHETIENKGGLGFYKGGNHLKVTDIHHCFLQPDPSNAIRNHLRAYAIENEISFYNTYKHEGFLRQLLIRTSETGALMVVLAVGTPDHELAHQILDELIEGFPQITSIYYTINEKKNNFLYDLKMIHYRGDTYITEELGHLKFKIQAKSFFQTNTKQGLELYKVVSQFADLSGKENIYDLYSGTGSIGLFLAHQADRVVGIEEIESAVIDAKKNATDNNITNAAFYLGRVRDILSEQFRSEHGIPDILITDPPRVGMHPDVIELLLQLAPPKIIYVSCNPATQARDINQLKHAYRLVKIQAVDMFPHTSHIESVALLIRK